MIDRALIERGFFIWAHSPQPKICGWRAKELAKQKNPAVELRRGFAVGPAGLEPATK